MLRSKELPPTSVGGASHAHDAAGAAVVAVQYPVDLQSQLLGDVGRIIRTRLRRNREPAEIFFLETGLPKRITDRVGVIPKD
jgi:hypothetical protein